MDNTKFIIGTIHMIDDDAIYVEDSIGTFHTQKKGHGTALEVSVLKNEGVGIPHFHFREDVSFDKHDDDIIDGCVELIVPKWFSHGKNHTSKLINKDTKMLNVFMKRKRKKGKYRGMTNWECSLMIWRKFNDPNFNIIMVQPDYSKLSVETYYRVTDNRGVGIYEVIKNKHSDQWKDFLALKDNRWLKKPPSDIGYPFVSYFTEEGYRKFNLHTYPYVRKIVNPSTIRVEMIEKRLGTKPLYQDDNQIIIRG